MRAKVAIFLFYFSWHVHILYFGSPNALYMLLYTTGMNCVLKVDVQSFLISFIIQLVYHPTNIMLLNNPTLTLKAETSTIDFHDFVESIYIEIKDNIPACMVGNKSRFLWNNLSSHYSPVICKLVGVTYNHLIINCPPYKPSDVPIEYFFCSLLCT